MFLFLHAGQVEKEQLVMAPFPLKSPEERTTKIIKLGPQIYVLQCAKHYTYVGMYIRFKKYFI